MVAAFDHRDQGRTRLEWLLLLDQIDSVELPTGRLVVLAAHPDDESLGAGGIIATAAARRQAIEIIIASDGEASHPHSPSHTPDQLARIRRVEATRAVSALAPDAAVHFLGLPDGQLTDHAAELETALHQALTTGPALLVSPWLSDRHPDHAACAAAARRTAARYGARVWEYPIWLWHWGDPVSDDIPRTALRRVPIEAGAARARQRALDCYPSQTRSLSNEPGDEAIVTENFTAHFTRPYDVIIDVAVNAAAHGPYFDDLYACSDDPWQLAQRWYERRKRQLLLASLPRPRFNRAFEPGCATGLLTEQLAARCDSLLAVDRAARAVELASERLRDAASVEVRRMNIVAEWPDEAFDLIVLSEVGYYATDLPLLASRVSGSLRADGVLVACHWRHAAAEHPQTAEAVHAALRELTPLYVQSTQVEDDFLLDVLSMTPDSVARADGIVQ